MNEVNAKLKRDRSKSGVESVVPLSKCSENINQKPSSRDQNNELFGERKSVVGALYVNNERARPHCVSAQPNATLAFVDMHSSSASRAGSLVALAAACVSALPTPALAATSLSFDAATGLISGTISTATVPSVTTVPAAAALLGAVGYTTAEKLIYGPFEAGFGRGPDETATSDTRPPFPCLDAATATYSGYCPGGMDVGTCEAGLYNSCAAGSVRASLFMDDCGGHANPYHHHTDPTCLYDASAEGHSALVGVMLDGCSGNTLSKGDLTIDTVLPRAGVSDNTANTSRNFMRNRVPHVQNSKNSQAILAAKPPIFGAFYSSFGRVELDFS